MGLYNSRDVDYRSAGVDIDAATKALKKVRDEARSTYQPGTLSDIGSFGGLFRLDTERYRRPVLVASTDGVGTKLKIAFETGRHRGVGYDLVSHCINDILVQGARPLFFLDYLAMGKLDGHVAAEVVAGLAEACRAFKLSLLGGETAEMPGFYRSGEYDVAGTIIGVVEEDQIIDGSNVTPGDTLWALPSTGLHTNGYSLARKILFDVEALDPSTQLETVGVSVADALLERHRCYLPALEPHLDAGRIHALAHITGGGMTDNVPRVLPEGCGVRIDLDTFELPPLFRFLMDKGSVPPGEMLRTFNCGVGMIVIANANLKLDGQWKLGSVVSGDGVDYVGTL